MKATKASRRTKRAFDLVRVRLDSPATLTDHFAEFVGAGVPSMFFVIGVHDPKDVEAARQPGGKSLPHQSLAILCADCRAVDQNEQ